MNRYLSYPWAFVCGFYYYIIFQLVYFARFGALNTTWSFADVFLPVVGVVSLLMFIFFAKRIGRRRELFFIPFLIALPFSVLGALGGGLLGFLGVLIFGILPFFIILPLGFWLVKKFARAEERAVEM